MTTLDHNLVQARRHLQEGAYYHRSGACVLWLNSTGTGRVDCWDTQWDNQACARGWQSPTEHSWSIMRLTSSSNELEQGVKLCGSLAW